MRRLSFTMLLAFLFMGSALYGFEAYGQGAAPGPEGAAYVPGELLVKYRPSLTAIAALYYQTHWDIASLRTFRASRVQHVKLPQDMTVEEALEVFKGDPDVEYAEPNYYCYAATTPNDTHFDELWGLNNTGLTVNGTGGTADADIDAPEAWDITTGSVDVIIAVVDSGLDYNHPDLTANIWTNPGEVPEDGQDNDRNGYNDDIRGWDFVDNDNDPIDPHGHGTHVAGTVAATGNNSAGITGACWRAKIIPLRILNAFGVGTTADAISAIEYANAKGAHIINNSWGGKGFSRGLKDAIDACSAVVVCAAGNQGTNNDSSPFYPASFTSTNIIAVAASNQNDNKASFSNYGAISVDVAAPGTNIYSCIPGRQTVWSDDFEGALDWSSGGSNNAWGLTSEASRSPTHSLTDRPNDDYLPDTDSYAQTPPVDLSSHSGTKLTFWVKGNSLSGDYFYLLASSDGIDWDPLTLLIDDEMDIYWSGSEPSFVKATADLGYYDGSDTFYVRFNFHANADADVAEGWFFEDVTITVSSTSYDGTEHRFMHGTSMATPHVSGLAALIKAHEPSLTNTGIKAAIDRSVDPKASLSGYVATGGRVNAHNGLTPPSAPTGLSATAALATQIDVSWTDNALNESGFIIESKIGSDGTYAPIATVSPNVTSFSDTGVAPSSTHYYRVRSYNWIDNSDYSNEDNATTPAAPPNSSWYGCFIQAAGSGFYR